MQEGTFMIKTIDFKKINYLCKIGKREDAILLILKGYEDYISRLANIYSKHFPVEEDDVKQAAYLSFIEKFDVFYKEQKLSNKTIMQSLRWAINEYVLRTSYGKSDAYNNILKQFSHIKMEFETSNIPFNEREIAKYLGKATTSVHNAIQYGKVNKSMRNYLPLSTIKNVVAYEDKYTFEEPLESRIEKIFTDKEKSVLDMSFSYSKPASFKRMALELGVSFSEAKNIYYTALYKAKQFYEDEEYDKNKDASLGIVFVDVNEFLR